MSGSLALAAPGPERSAGRTAGRSAGRDPPALRLGPRAACRQSFSSEAAAGFTACLLLGLMYVSRPRKWQEAQQKVQELQASQDARADQEQRIKVGGSLSVPGRAPWVSQCWPRPFCPGCAQWRLGPVGACVRGSRGHCWLSPCVPGPVLGARVPLWIGGASAPEKLIFYGWRSLSDAQSSR